MYRVGNFIARKILIERHGRRLLPVGIDQRRLQKRTAEIQRGPTAHPYASRMSEEDLRAPDRRMHVQLAGAGRVQPCDLGIGAYLTCLESAVTSWLDAERASI